MKYLIFIFILFPGLIIFPCVAFGQQKSELPAIDISKIEFEKDIRENMGMVFGDPIVSSKDLAALNLSPGLINKGKLQPGQVANRVYVSFNTINPSSKAVAVYFFPGRYFSGIKLYKKQNNVLVSLADSLPVHRNNLSYRMFSLGPADSAIIIAELKPVKTYTNQIRARLINSIYIDSFIRNEQNFKPQIRIFSFILCGILLMMVFFSSINFLLGANKDFFYYAGYAFFLGVMLFLKALVGFHSSWFNFFMEGYFDFMLMCTGHLFYLNFIRQFLDAPLHHAYINKLCKSGMYVLLAAMVAYSVFHFYSPAYTPEYLVENFTKFFLLILALLFVWYARRHRDNKIFRYMAWGNISLLLLSGLSYFFTFVGPVLTYLPEIFSTSLFYYQLAILFELVFFLAGLSYKNKKQIIEQTRERERLKTENQMKEIEKQLAVLKTQKDERNRISLDMHDELGSGMTAIRLMSEMAKTKMKENIPPEMDKISDSANEVLNKMNAIIWSMNSGNDTLDNLVAYIRAYAMEYLENIPIACTVTWPEKSEQHEVSGDKRRNLFMCIKETLNNAVKHSGASAIKIEIEANHQLTIRIHDNGKGIDLENIRQFGNGLKNIKKRMESIGGSFNIEKLNGTQSTFTLPL